MSAVTVRAAGTSRRRVRWAALGAAVVLAGCCAGWLAPRVAATGPVLFGEVSITGGGAGGATRLEVPIVGAVEADTHDGPLGVVVRAESVDLDALGDARTGDLGAEALEARATRDLEALAADWVRHALAAGAVLGTASGLVVAALVRPRRLREVGGYAAAGCASALVVVAAMAGRAGASFEAGAFDAPRYSGALVYAPDVLGAVSGGGLAGVREGAGSIAGRLDRLVRVRPGVEAAQRTEGDVVVLHVSDLHLNPLGLELTRRLVQQFSPDVVLDSGDFTSFGVTPAEGGFAALADVGVPYYLVGGNHDSEAALDAASAAGVRVLDGGVVEVGGLSIAGLADPTFTPREPVADEELAAAYDAQRRELEALAHSSGADVVVVHNPGMASTLAGRDVTVLSGHIHRFAAEADGPTRLAVSGSTGSGGLASLAGQGQGRYEAQLLTFRPGDDGRMQLVWIDRIVVSEAALSGTGGGESSVERLEASSLREGEFLGGGSGVVPEGPLGEGRETAGTGDGGSDGGAPAAPGPGG